jgi:hypothetical protein
MSSFFSRSSSFAISFFRFLLLVLVSPGGPKRQVYVPKYETRAQLSSTKGRLIMNWMNYLAIILLSVFLAANASAQDIDPLGSATDAAAKVDVGETMADDLFNPLQDQKGSATPVLMGRNVPENLGTSQPKARLLSPSNKWHLDLRDTMDRVVELEMYQSNDVIFGKGTIAVDGDARNVTATGTTTGNKLNLDILTDELSLFRLALTMNGKSLSGDYHIYSASYVPGKGIAMGKIS